MHLRGSGTDNRYTSLTYDFSGIYIACKYTLIDKSTRNTNVSFNDTGDRVMQSAR